MEGKQLWSTRRPRGTAARSVQPPRAAQPLAQLPESVGFTPPTSAASSPLEAQAFIQPEAVAAGWSVAQLQKAGKAAADGGGPGLLRARTAATASRAKLSAATQALSAGPYVELEPQDCGR